MTSERCGRNLLRYCASPSNLCTPALSVGGGISLIARTLAGSTRRPLSVAIEEGSDGIALNKVTIPLAFKIVTPHVKKQTWPTAVNFEPPYAVS